MDDFSPTSAPVSVPSTPIDSVSAQTSASPCKPILFLHQPIAWLRAFWRFSRPHTIAGTTLSVLGVGAIALATIAQEGRLLNWQDGLLLFGLPLLACLGGNIYIVGLNQLEDIAIDRINKPQLPLASGEFSPQQGWWLVGVTGSLALALSAWRGGALMATIWISLLIGTAYSLPPIRLKRFPVWASLCILSVRGAIVNLGLFLYFQQSLAPAPLDIALIPPHVWALTLFVLVFTFAIAIFKDIPDVEGDRRYHITTFTVKLGQQAVFDLARWVVTLCYGGLILASLWLSGVDRWALIVSHSGILGWFWLRSVRVDLADKGAIASFYQFIWKLFFLEYLLFPALCWLAS